MAPTTQPKASGSTSASVDGADTRTIPVREIRDRKSFEALASESGQIAGVYFYAVLDFLVQIAYKASKDFFERPHLYVDLGRDAIPPKIAQLRSRSGSDELIPSREQRAEIYLPLVGITDGLDLSGTGDFQEKADRLMVAATAFSERVYDTGQDQLRARVRVAHRLFKEYLKGLEGTSLSWTSEHVLPNVTEKIAFPILRNTGIAAVFAVSTGIDPDWPYAEDSNADKMVEEMSKQLPWADGSPLHLSRERISNLQSIAVTGSRAIAAVLDYDGDRAKVKDLDYMIEAAYVWASELNERPQIAASPS